MKGISPMIATVLLIAFTVAVGSILAVWFSTYTKTQTSSVSKTSACASTFADIKALSLSNDKLTMMITNKGDQSITVNSIVLTCGTKVGIVNDTTVVNIVVPASSQNTTTIDLTSDVDPAFSSGDCRESNLEISITYACEKGGTNSAECPVGTCFS